MTDQGVGVAEGAGEGLGGRRVGVADVAELHHGLAADRRLGALEVVDPVLDLPAPRLERRAGLAPQPAGTERPGRRRPSGEDIRRLVGRLAGSFNTRRR